MFTGIVKQISEVAMVQRRAESLRIGIDLDALAAEVEPGDSVLIDGVCLTATVFSDDVVFLDVATETAGLTTLKDLSVGRRVNVEPAMRPSDRFGGHFVSGHVDGTGEVVSAEETSGEVRMRLRTGSALIAQMIPKGSVAVNGISLTIADLSDEELELSLIPHTMRSTTLDSLSAGDMVNIECYMIGKWIIRLMGACSGEGRPDDRDDAIMEKLERMFQEEP